MTTAAGVNAFHLSFPPKWQTYFDRNEANLQSHQLVWADRQFDDIDINEEELFSTLTQFRQLVNYTKAFDHWGKCVEHIEKNKADTFTFLVCSANYAKDIVQRLCPFTEAKVWKIYVYCRENQQNQFDWLENLNHKKRCSVHMEQGSLLSAIQKDVQEYRIHEKAGIFSDVQWTPENSIDENEYSWWRNLTNVLVCLPYPQNYHHQLVHEFEKHGLKGDILKEFQSDFPSNHRAVWWYSRSGYFYGVLNRALRQRNIRVVLLFGSFLQDLHQQLKSEHMRQKQQREDPVTTVYRGQVLSSSDFDKLLVGFPIRCNSFFSTSTERDEALGFLLSSSTDTDIERVLFEVEIDYRTVCPPFADISQFSFYPTEQETLFMSRTRFSFQSRQQEVHVVDGFSVPYWLVKLKLLSECDLYSGRKLEASNAPRKTVKNCVDALSEIQEMVSTEDVRLVFDALASLYPKEQHWIEAIRLYCLGILGFESNNDNYRMMVKYHEQAIAIWKKYYLTEPELNGHFNIAQNHFALGRLFGYCVENQKNLAIYHWEQALNFYELALPKCATVATDYDRVSIGSRLVTVCGNLLRTGDLERYGSKTVIYQKEWMELMLHRNPARSTSREFAIEFTKLGDIYAAIHRYDDAVSNYEEAINLYMSSDNSDVEHRPLPHDLIDLCQKITTICTEHTHDSTLLLKYQLLQHECKLKLFGDVSSGALFLIHKTKCLAESYFSVADCFIETKQYVAAYKHLIKGLEYTRLSKERLSQTGLTQAWRDGRHILVPLAADDRRLVHCERRIKEMEEKLRVIEPLLEES